MSAVLDEQGLELTPEAQEVRAEARNLSPGGRRFIMARYQPKYRKLVGKILSGRISRPIDWRWQDRYRKCRTQADYRREFARTCG